MPENFSSVNGVNGAEKNVKIPNSCNYENQQSIEVPPVLNSVFQDVINSGNCEIKEENIPGYGSFETTTCNGGRIDKLNHEIFSIDKFKTGKDENQCENNFDEYLNGPDDIDCHQSQVYKPCQ